MSMKKEWARKYLEKLRPRIQGRAEEKIPMKQYTTFRIGGFVDVMVWPRSLADLKEAIDAAQRMEIEWGILGAGSNLLVKDGGLDMVLLNMNEVLKDMDASDKNGSFEAGAETGTVRLGAGLKLPRAAKECQERGLSGLEFAAGIPGSVGGGVIMNAGSMGTSMADVLEWVEWYTPERGLERVSRSELDYGYRRLSCPDRAVITACGVTLRKDDPRAVRERIVKGLKWRRQNQPLSYPSAGSVFKNPPGDYSGRLIEEAGLKGARQGDAQVSELHANFIINRGRARSRDVTVLIDRVREEVERSFKINLELEIKIMGEEIS
ncbi:MAG: UDP-N-acetylmuramate dehydrogenase [bacterium]